VPDITRHDDPAGEAFRLQLAPDRPGPLQLRVERRNSMAVLLGRGDVNVSPIMELSFWGALESETSTHAAALGWLRTKIRQGPATR
jgi:hypothetical protein